MHKKAQVTKDETLSVASRSNGLERKDFIEPDIDQAEQEEKFLSDMLIGYNYWRKQPGDQAKAYAAAYRTLINEFTAEETEK